MLEDEELLLAVLNSSPADGDRRREELAGDAGARLAQRFGGTGSAAEIARLRRVRNALQRVVGGDVRAVGELAALAEGVALAPEVEASGLRWRRAPRGTRARRLVRGSACAAEPFAGLCQRRMQPLPHRPQSAGDGQVVLDGNLRQPHEGPRACAARPAWVTASIWA